MKTSKRQPIGDTSFLGFKKNHTKPTDKLDNDLVSFIVTLIEMDKQHKAQSSSK